jgi:hypothetical protein
LSVDVNVASFKVSLFASSVRALPCTRPIVPAQAQILISTVEVLDHLKLFHDEQRMLLIFTPNSSMLRTGSIKLTKSACFLYSLLTMESRSSLSRKWWPEPSNKTSDTGCTVCQTSSVPSPVCAHNTHSNFTLYALENFKLDSYN